MYIRSPRPEVSKGSEYHRFIGFGCAWLATMYMVVSLCVCECVCMCVYVCVCVCVCVYLGGGWYSAIQDHRKNF